MGMTDKQYDGMLLDFIEDFADIEEAAKELPDSEQKKRVLDMIQKKKIKTERKLESPIRP